MSDMEQDADIHERYLSGELSDQERLAYEARMMEDPAFAADLRSFQAARAAVIIAGETILRNKLNAIHQDLDPPRTAGGARVIPIARRRWLALAASLVLMLGAAWYFLGREPSMEDLYAAHMTPYPAPERLRDDGSTSDAWSRFGDLYAAGRYDEAIVELAKVPAAEIPAYLRSFYRGQCALLKSSPDATVAKADLDEVLRTDNDLHAAAHWYLALCALKSGDRSAAIQHLKTLEQAAAYKRNEAAELLRVLGGS